jgi:hypothetical protein
MQETPLSPEWRFAVPRWSLAPQNVAAGGSIHRAYLRLPRPVYPLLRAASLAVALAGCLLFIGLAGIFPAAGTSLALIYLQSQCHFMLSIFLKSLWIL